MKLVMAFGTFDVLHPGHIAYLEEARKMGDALIVVVARDSSVVMIKGRRPVFGEKERLKIVSSLKTVDMAVLGAKVKTENGRFGIIRRFRPSVIALGYDQQKNAEALEAWLKEKGIGAKVVRMKALKPDTYRSSLIKNRL
jgi:FAD synthetase